MKRGGGMSRIYLLHACIRNNNMTIINLLQETLISLKGINKTPDDVRYVILDSRRTTFEDFSEAAKNIEYDKGYGSIH
jgi:hypothetical protein